MRKVGGKLLLGLSVVLVLLSSATGLLSQEPPQPVEPRLPVPRAAGPEALVPSNAQAFVIIRNIQAFDRKLAETGNRIVPGSVNEQRQEGQPAGAASGPILQNVPQLAPMIADDSPLILLMMISPEAGAEPVTGLMFRPRAGSPVAGLGNEPRQIEQLQMFAVAGPGGMVLAGPDERISQFAGAETGVRLDASRRLRLNESDAFAFANIAAMVKSGEPSYKQQRQQVEEQIRQMEQGGDDQQWAKAMIPMMRLQMETMDRFWSLARQGDWASMSLLLDEQAADVEAGMAFVEGSPLAGYLSEHPPMGRNLTPGLPDVEAFGAFWYSLDRERTLALLNAMMDQALQMQQSVLRIMPEGEGNAQMRQQLQQQQEQLRQTQELLKSLNWLEFRGAFAMMAPPAGQQGLRAVQSVKLTDVENWRQQLQQYIEKARGISPMGPGMPGTMELTYEPRQRTVNGMEVDRYTQRLVLPEEPPQDPQEQMALKIVKGLFGPDGQLVSWLTERGGYMLSQTGPEPDMLQQMAAAVEGGGLAKSEKFAKLSQYIVPQANVVGYVSLGRISRGIRDIAMMANGGQPPQEQQGEQRAETFSVISEALVDGRSHARMYIPIAELQEAAVNLMPLFMQMQQQGHEQPGQPQPGRRAPSDGQTQPDAAPPAAAPEDNTM